MVLVLFILLTAIVASLPFYGVLFFYFLWHMDVREKCLQRAMILSVATSTLYVLCLLLFSSISLRILGLIVVVFAVAYMLTKVLVIKRWFALVAALSIILVGQLVPSAILLVFFGAF